jgi:hypothetical protein
MQRSQLVGAPELGSPQVVIEPSDLRAAKA